MPNTETSFRFLRESSRTFCPMGPLITLMRCSRVSILSWPECMVSSAKIVPRNLDWRWHQRGLELGCIFSINPDAHSTSEIDLTRWGLAMARKGDVPAERVLNALDLSSFRAYVQTRKNRPSAHTSSR